MTEPFQRRGVGQAGDATVNGIAPGPTATGLFFQDKTDEAGRSGREIEETTRLYLECDQRVGEVAQRLTVHKNTVRYRVNRFRELIGLDVRRTEDLVTAWWLLNRRRSPR